MENSILLSYIVPVYNVERYLEKCIQSLLFCDEEVYEIILVDDGSKDRCPEICDKYAKEYKYISVIHKTNGGLSEARNVGLKAAKGRYVYFVDSDDYLLPNATDRLIEIIRHSDCDVVCCGAIHERQGQQCQYLFFDPEDIVCGEEFLKIQYKNKMMQVAVWNSFYKRVFLEQNGLLFKKGILHEDIQWTPRVFLAAESVCCQKSPVYVYQLREGSISSQKDMSKNLLDIKNTVIELSQELKGKTSNETYRMIKDSLVCSYLSMFSKGDFCSKGEQFYLDKKLIRDDLFFIKTKIKANIFVVSKRLYCMLRNCIIKEG